MIALYFCIYWIFGHFPPKKGYFWLKLPKNYRDPIICRALASKKSPLKSRFCSDISNVFGRKTPDKIQGFSRGSFRQLTLALKRLGYRASEPASPPGSLPYPPQKTFQLNLKKPASETSGKFGPEDHSLRLDHHRRNFSHPVDLEPRRAPQMNTNDQPQPGRIGAHFHPAIGC